MTDTMQMNIEKEVKNMLNKKGLWLGMLLALLLPLAVAQADGVKDFVLSQLDGKGTVDSIDVDGRSIVINDRTYTLSRSATVFNVVRRTNSAIDNINAGDNVGFKAKPLPKATAPYDQLIVKLWVLPSGS